jgi:hypothetical protein
VDPFRSRKAAGRRRAALVIWLTHSNARGDGKAYEIISAQDPSGSLKFATLPRRNLSVEARDKAAKTGAQTRATSIDNPRRQYPLHVDENCLTQSVADIEAQRAQEGIDVVSDGEFGKSIIWGQYVLERFAEFYTELDAREPIAAATVSGQVKL